MPSMITVWMKDRTHVELMNVILWRVKNIKRMADDSRGRHDGPGKQFVLNWIDAVSKYAPTILEILFENPPLSPFVEALKSLDEALVRSHLDFLERSYT